MQPATQNLTVQQQPRSITNTCVSATLGGAVGCCVGSFVSAPQAGCIIGCVLGGKYYPQFETIVTHLYNRTVEAVRLPGRQE